MIRSMNVAIRRAALLFAMMAFGISATAWSQDQAEMEAMMKAATPGPHHEQLAKMVGSWKTSSKMWMAPEAPPVETAGTSEISSLLGGRFVREVTKAPMMGMPWEGHGIFGYDNAQEKHVSIWYDSFGTMMMYFEGSCTGNCNTVTMKSNYFDPMTQSKKTMKTVSKKSGDDKVLLTLYDVAKDGSETKMVEITYARTGGQAQR